MGWYASQLALQLLFKAAVYEADRRHALLEEAEKRGYSPPALSAWSPSRGLKAAASALGLVDWRRRLRLDTQRLVDLFR